MSSFLLTLEAKKDLEEIHDFIAQDNPSIAVCFINSNIQVIRILHAGRDVESTFNE